jgi:hypothetical protein
MPSATEEKSARARSPFSASSLRSGGSTLRISEFAMTLSIGRSQCRRTCVRTAALSRAVGSSPAAATASSISASRPSNPETMIFRSSSNLLPWWWKSVAIPTFASPAMSRMDVPW